MGKLILPGSAEFAAPETGVVAGLPEPALRLEEHDLSALEAAAKAGFRALEIGIGQVTAGLSSSLPRGKLISKMRSAEITPGVFSWQGLAAAKNRGRRGQAVENLRALIETAQAFSVKTIAVRPWREQEVSAGEAWRYLLDAVYLVEKDLREAGVALALEPGAGVDDALRDEVGCRACLAEAPENTGLALDEFFCVGENDETVSALAKSARHSRLHAPDGEQGARLSPVGETAKLLGKLTGAGYGGLVAVRPELSGADLPGLYQEIALRLCAAGVGVER
jgi:sugar phosphate isomerase/epimerase